MPVLNLETLARDFRRTPPVVRSICLVTLALTFYTVFNPVYRVPQLVYRYDLVFKRYEVWRLVTSFFLGSRCKHLIVEVAMLYQTINTLESGPYRHRSGDLAWQMFFACIGILGATRLLKPTTHLDAFIACLSSLTSLTAPPGSTAYLMRFLKFRIGTVPYLLIALSFVKSGPPGAALVFAGTVVGFVWFHLIWEGFYGSSGQPGILAEYGRAPGWVRRLFGEEEQPTNGGGLKKGEDAGEGIGLKLGIIGPCTTRFHAAYGSSAAAAVFW